MLVKTDERANDEVNVRARIIKAMKLAAERGEITDLPLHEERRLEYFKGADMHMITHGNFLGIMEDIWLHGKSMPRLS